MATEAIAGYKAAIYFSTAEGQSLSRLAELRSYSLVIEQSLIDISSFDDGSETEWELGEFNWNGSADLLHLQGDDTHKAVYDLLRAGTTVDMEFYPSGSSGGGAITGTGKFTGFELGAPGEDVLASDIMFIGTGGMALFQGYVYPEDRGNGRWRWNSIDTGLRLADLGNGRFNVSSSGTYVGIDGGVGRAVLTLE